MIREIQSQAKLGGGWLLEEKHAYVQSMLMYLSINVVETPELLVITKAYN